MRLICFSVHFVKCILLAYGQARSQDFVKGGGAFLKGWDNCKQPWPKFSLLWIQIETDFFVPNRKFKQKKKVFAKIETDFFGPKSEFQTVFPPKYRWSPKKKGLRRNWDGFFGLNRKFKRFFRPNTGDLPNKKRKKVFAEIETDFFGPNRKFKRFFRPNTGDLQKKKAFAEIETDFSVWIGNSNGFSAQKQVISLTKKKGLRRNWDGFFGPNRKFKQFFRAKTGDLQKKKNLRPNWDEFAEIRNHGNSFTTSAPISLWGGCFHFWSKDRPQKH